MLEAVAERLEVDVPDPRNVPAVRDPVVERDQRRGGRPAVDERTDRLVRPGRVLDQQDQHGAVVADRDPLEPAEGGAEAREPTGDLVERRSQRAGERGCGERVVDVVEPGQGQLDPPRPLRRDEVERRAVEAT